MKKVFDEFDDEVEDTDEAGKYDIASDQKGKDQGVLLGSGFIAGEGLMGVVIAVLAVIMTRAPKFLEIHYPAKWMGMLVSGIVFSLLGWFLFSVAAKSKKR